MPPLYHRARLHVITFRGTPAIKPASSAPLKALSPGASTGLPAPSWGTNCSARRCAGRPECERAGVPHAHQPHRPRRRGRGRSRHVWLRRRATQAAKSAPAAAGQSQRSVDEAATAAAGETVRRPIAGARAADAAHRACPAPEPAAHALVDYTRGRAAFAQFRDLSTLPTAGRRVEAKNFTARCRRISGCGRRRLPTRHSRSRRRCGRTGSWRRLTPVRRPRLPPPAAPARNPHPC